MVVAQRTDTNHALPAESGAFRSPGDGATRRFGSRTRTGSMCGKRVPGRLGGLKACPVLKGSLRARKVGSAITNGTAR